VSDPHGWRYSTYFWTSPTSRTDRHVLVYLYITVYYISSSNTQQWGFQIAPWLEVTYITGSFPFALYLLTACSLGPIFALPLSLLLPGFNTVCIYSLTHGAEPFLRCKLYYYHAFLNTGRSQRSIETAQGRVISQAVSRRFLTAAPRVRAQVKSCGICGGQSGTGAAFLRVFQFPLPNLIPLTAPHSSPIFRGWYNWPVSGRRTKWTQSHPTPRNLRKKESPMVGIFSTLRPAEARLHSLVLHRESSMYFNVYLKLSFGKQFRDFAHHHIYMDAAS
jgi:hypothetical protein